MNCFRLIAELRSPLMRPASDKPGGPRGLPLLTGSTLRGAVAGQMLRRGVDPGDADFRQLFLETPPHFPDLLPAARRDESPRPYPLTAHSCKRRPGFQTGSGEECGHGVFDTLAAVAAGQWRGVASESAFSCPDCGADLKPRSGFWNGRADAPSGAEPVVVYERHTGIDRATGTVAPSIFFTVEGLADFRKGLDGEYRPQYLSGEIFLSPEQETVLRRAIQEPVFAGGDRTRGMGELRLGLEESEFQPPDPVSWNRDFRKKLQAIAGDPLPDGLLFSVDLTAHAILVDGFLRPRPDLALDFPDIETVARVVRSRLVKGWQASWQLPKPDDIALAMGAVFLFRYTGADEAGLIEYLRRLAKEGIGLRRSEGFGRVRICDPLHLREVI
jgi:CRISPR-associated protein Csx10